MAVWHRSATGRAFLLVAALLATSAAAQQIRFDIGFSGEIVADAWNPLRLTLRDQPSAELIVEIDQGSLREGERLIHYAAPLAGGSGVSVFEDDVYIPAWRTFTWRVESEGFVLASGSIDRRRVDPRPLELVLAAQLGSWRGLFGADARVIDLSPHELPERSAAYDGVRTFVIDGSAAPPRVEAVAAATAAGVATVLLDPLPQGYGALRALAPAETQRLGAGWLIRTDADQATSILNGLERLEPSELLTALQTAELTRMPAALPAAALVTALAGYLLVISVLVRFGGIPGLLAALSLTLVGTLATWGYLRPSEATAIRSRTLSLSAGGLAQVLELRTLLRLPEGTVQIPVSARPLDFAEYRQRADALELHMWRWTSATLAVKPRLESARLAWQDGSLVNQGGGTLVDVFVIGSGAQGTLAARADTRVQANANRNVPAIYEELLTHLPTGSALARSGGRIYVALPEPEVVAGRQP